MRAVMKLHKGVNMEEITNINGLWKVHIETYFKTFRNCVCVLSYVSVCVFECVENYMQIN